MNARTLRSLFAMLATVTLLAASCAREKSTTAPPSAAKPSAPIPSRPATDAVSALPPTSATLKSPPATLSEFAGAADRFGDIISIPTFEQSPAAVVATTDATIVEASTRLDELAAQDPTAATFDSTVLALDDIMYPVLSATNRLYLIKETSTDPDVRESATSQVQRLQDWFTDAQYREDVYTVCKAFEDAYRAGRRARLFGEDLRLLEETMRDYRRAGLHLDAATRDRVVVLQKELTSLSTTFGTNITNANVTVFFTEEELAGVPESLLDQLKAQGKVENGVEHYGIKATVTPQFVTAMQNMSSEASRKKLKTARYSVAQAENTPILNELIRVRDEIAHLLGYNSWNDYQIEPKMAKTGDRAIRFVTDLKEGLEPKFQAELAEMAALKRVETGDPNATIRHWDWRYYENQLKKQKYDIDSEALRVYFPLDRVIEGLFGIYEEIFGIQIDRVAAPWVWFDEVALYAVRDAATREPLGMVYFDLFPREGKYNHFAQFDITGGKQLRDGRYQRPVCALVCNFTPPRGDAPSLLSHAEVETFFHEFGHAMHTILTRARHARFAGTNVPRDFVEAPSQMLEAWVWDTSVLDRFAADYRDPSKNIDPKILARMKEAKRATIGTFYRRQLALATADLRMHQTGETKDSQEVMNQAFEDVFLPAPSGTNMAAYFGHMTGYDSGYYGYAWADAIAVDLATAFADSPDGLMSKEIGRRLRDEIYGAGGGRDVEKSIRAFLGRERSLSPFLREIGIEN